MPVLRHSPLLLALALSGLWTHCAVAVEAAAKPAAQSSVRVIASLPITFGLSQALLQGSSVVLERAAPATLPGSRQAAYFSGRGAPELQKLAQHADAAIGLRSIWPDDPLYPDARRSNIRIVEIDAARPVDGALPGVALQPGSTDGLNAQPWQSSNNLGRMADVLAADLVRLAPADKTIIDANLATLKKRLLTLTAKAEAQLARADNLSVISLSDRLGYLASGLNLDVVAVDARPDNEWTDEALKQLQQQLKDNGVAWVLHHREPSAAVKAAVEGAGSHLLVLETDSADPVQELEGNIKRVTDALSRGA